MQEEEVSDNESTRLNTPQEQEEMEEGSLGGAGGVGQEPQAINSVDDDVSIPASQNHSVADDDSDDDVVMSTSQAHNETAPSKAAPALPTQQDLKRSAASHQRALKLAATPFEMLYSDELFHILEPAALALSVHPAQRFLLTTELITQDFSTAQPHPAISFWPTLEPLLDMSREQFSLVGLTAMDSHFGFFHLITKGSTISFHIFDTTVKFHTAFKESAQLLMKEAESRGWVMGDVRGRTTKWQKAGYGSSCGALSVLGCMELVSHEPDWKGYRSMPAPSIAKVAEIYRHLSNWREAISQTQKRT